jgi:hypothetical protein
MLSAIFRIEISSVFFDFTLDFGRYLAPLVAIGSITGKFRERVGHSSISDLKSNLVILNSYNCLK